MTQEKFDFQELDSPAEMLQVMHVGGTAFVSAYPQKNVCFITKQTAHPPRERSTL